MFGYLRCPFAGGTLATAGNLVLSAANDQLMAFRADTGENLLELPMGLSQMGRRSLS
jgi:hypothetical protein